MKKMNERTTEELITILNNLKTSAFILGFTSESDNRMIEEIEVELANRK